MAYEYRIVEQMTVSGRMLAFITHTNMPEDGKELNPCDTQYFYQAVPTGTDRASVAANLMDMAEAFKKPSIILVDRRTVTIVADDGQYVGSSPLAEASLS